MYDSLASAAWVNFALGGVDSGVSGLVVFRSRWEPNDCETQPLRSCRSSCLASKQRYVATDYAGIFINFNCGLSRFRARGWAGIWLSALPVVLPGGAATGRDDAFAGDFGWRATMVQMVIWFVWPPFAPPLSHITVLLTIQSTKF
jgi:hypothetical protein